MSVALHPPASALVVRTDRDAHESYLLVAPSGAMDWVDKPAAATVFGSMRDALRVATRLPARLRAYGLPAEAAHQSVH